MKATWFVSLTMLSCALAFGCSAQRLDGARTSITAKTAAAGAATTIESKTVQRTRTLKPAQVVYSDHLIESDGDVVIDYDLIGAPGSWDRKTPGGVNITIRAGGSVTIYGSIRGGDGMTGDSISLDGGHGGHVYISAPIIRIADQPILGGRGGDGYYSCHGGGGGSVTLMGKVQGLPNYKKVGLIRAGDGGDGGEAEPRAKGSQFASHGGSGGNGGDACIFPHEADEGFIGGEALGPIDEGSYYPNGVDGAHGRNGIDLGGMPGADGLYNGPCLAGGAGGTGVSVSAGNGGHGRNGGDAQGAGGRGGDGGHGGRGGRAIAGNGGNGGLAGDCCNPPGPGPKGGDAGNGGHAIAGRGGHGGSGGDGMTSGLGGLAGNGGNGGDAFGGHGGHGGNGGAGITGGLGGTKGIGGTAEFGTGGHGGQGGLSGDGRFRALIGNEGINGTAAPGVDGGNGIPALNCDTHGE